MTVLVTGAGGQLGHHLARLDPSVVALGRAELDITSRASVDAAIARYRPDIVINAAAYTAVDAAESDLAGATAGNVDGPANLASALAASGGRLVHVSTDYVFDGSVGRPLAPGDPTGPRTVYGRTKLAGEDAVRSLLAARSTIVRTAWVYGGPSANFVDTMRRLEGERDTVDVVADQSGSPTYVADLAAGLLALAASDVDGVTLHYANAGTATWHQLASAVFELLGADPARVRPTTSAAFVRPAPRPAWSVLDTSAWVSAGLPAPRPWRDALAEYLAIG